MGEYSTEISFDTIKLYSEVEMEFFQGPRVRYLKALKLWIKMLVWERDLKNGIQGVKIYVQRPETCHKKNLKNNGWG